jgi:hypothetical protein
MRKAQGLHKQRQVFAGMFSDTEEHRNDGNLCYSRSNQGLHRLGQVGCA